LGKATNADIQYSENKVKTTDSFEDGKGKVYATVTKGVTTITIFFFT